jgi:putative acetyltransferase
MNLKIRTVEITDVRDLHEIRVQNSSIENTLAIKSMTISRTENFIRNLTPDSHYMVAEVDDGDEDNRKVVGVCVLTVSSSPKLRHSASVGINVHEDYQGKGIGRRLMNTSYMDEYLMARIN